MNNSIANNEVMTTLSNMKGINLMMTASEKEISIASKVVNVTTTKVEGVSSALAQKSAVDIAVVGNTAGDVAANDKTDNEFTATDVGETNTGAEDIASDDVVTDTSEGDIQLDEMPQDGGIGMDESIGGGDFNIGIGDFGENYGDTGSMIDPGMPQIKDPLLSSWPFVIGISVAVLAVSIVLGGLLAKRKIKKGIELYED